VLADGRHDVYLTQVEVPYESGTSRVVVDLVQVFHGQAAVEAAIADGKPREAAQYRMSTFATTIPGCGSFCWPATCGSTWSAAATVLPDQTSSTTWAY
jgi:hypothetical protein